MNTKASVLVRLDTSRRCAVLEIKGVVTAENCQGILPVVERTRSLPGMGSVEVDLSFASTVEPAAVNALRNAGCNVALPAAEPAGVAPAASASAFDRIRNGLAPVVANGY